MCLLILIKAHQLPCRLDRIRIFYISPPRPVVDCEYNEVSVSPDLTGYVQVSHLSTTVVSLSPLPSNVWVPGFPALTSSPCLRAGAWSRWTPTVTSTTSWPSPPCPASQSSPSRCPPARAPWREWRWACPPCSGRTRTSPSLSSSTCE